MHLIKFIFHPQLKANTDKDKTISSLQSQYGNNGSCQITHADWSPALLNGFAATLQDDALNSLRANPAVDFIAEDGIAHSQATITQSVQLSALGFEL